MDCNKTDGLTTQDLMKRWKLKKRRKVDYFCHRKELPFEKIGRIRLFNKSDVVSFEKKRRYII